MTSFFTSAADIYGENRLNPANGFIEALRESLPSPCRGLFICSDPDNHASTDFYWAQLCGFLAAEGIHLTHCRTLDGRNADHAADLIADSDSVVLSGGHVPTQNAFFERIGLREIIKGFDGTIMSISAGTMNSADRVYAMPELPGEASAPGFRRTLRGLGLTNINVIPHFQYIRTITLDGIPMIDIALADSKERKLYAINDGSYIYAKDGVQELRGEAYLIENGVMTRICSDGGSIIV